MRKLACYICNTCRAIISYRPVKELEEYATHYCNQECYEKREEDYEFLDVEDIFIADKE